MNFKLRDIAEIVAIASVVASLVFVGYEIRLSRSVALNESSGTAAEISIALNDLISSHPIVWEKGCLGNDLTTEENIIFSRLVSALDRVNFAKYQRATQGIINANSDIFSRSMAKNLATFPGLRQKWRLIADSILSTQGQSLWISAVEQEFDKLDIIESETNATSMICGFG